MPFVLAYPPGATATRSLVAGTEGKLCDVAPTILAVMGLPIPAEMDGHSLLA